MNLSSFRKETSYLPTKAEIRGAGIDSVVREETEPIDFEKNLHRSCSL